MKGIPARACSYDPLGRLLVGHQLRAPCSLRRQGPYNLHLPMVSRLEAILNFRFVEPPVTALVTYDAFFPTQLKLILRITCCLLKHS